MNGSKKSIKLEIGPWNYYPEFGRFLKKDGKEFFLDKRLNKLLQVLLHNQENIVKREELLDLVWENVQVTEDSLTKGIFDLRKLFKEKGITELEIETIRNIGYRLKLREEEPKLRPVGKLLLRSAFYLFLLVSFLALFIRAIRYEN